MPSPTITVPDALRRKMIRRCRAGRRCPCHRREGSAIFQVVMPLPPPPLPIAMNLSCSANVACRHDAIFLIDDADAAIANPQATLDLQRAEKALQFNVPVNPPSPTVRVAVSWSAGGSAEPLPIVRPFVPVAEVPLCAVGCTHDKTCPAVPMRIVCLCRVDVRRAFS